jgi:toxin FitB
MIVLDTNVVSELFKQTPDVKVLDWLSSLNPNILYISAPTIMELWSGVSRLPIGKKRRELEEKIVLITEKYYVERILILDENSAKQSGSFLAGQFQNGLKPSVANCQIAAIAFTKGFAVATRDTSDFDHDGLKLINPWEAR